MNQGQKKAMLGLFAVISISVAGRPELEGMSKAELIDRIRSLEAKLQPQRQKLWPELQKTPTMMWNGWLPTTRGLIPGMKNNETLYYAAVDRLVSSGLRDAGYDTIAATCMGWERDPVTKKLRANPKTWPRGFKNWVSYAHEKKIKICAYSDTGVLNCCGGAATSNGKPEPGMFGYEELDIATFAEWGASPLCLYACMGFDFRLYRVNPNILLFICVPPTPHTHTHTPSFLFLFLFFCCSF